MTTNMKNMLPWSNLQQLKEKTIKLNQLLNLINMRLNAQKIKKNNNNNIEDDYEEQRVLKKVKTMSYEDSFHPTTSKEKSSSDKNLNSSVKAVIDKESLNRNGIFLHGVFIINFGKIKINLYISQIIYY